MIMFFFFNVYSISTSSSSSQSESITRSGLFSVSDSVKRSTNSLAALAIATLKRSKPELSAFPGLNQAISLSRVSLWCADKTKQWNDLIIISWSRSDQAFKIHWTIYFNEGSCNITSLGMCVKSLIHSLVIHFSQVIFYRLLFPWYFCFLISPVTPPGMTMGSIFALLSNSFKLWTRWALKLSCTNNLLLPKVKVFKTFSTSLWLYSHLFSHLWLIQRSNDFWLQDLFSNLNFAFISWKDDIRL